MRELTEEERAFAPDWAVKFDFFEGSLIFMSDAVEVTSQTSTFRFIDIYSGDYWVGSDGDYTLCTRSISSKPFDICKEEVYDYLGLDIHGDLEVLEGDWTICKERAIAIAKALGVKGEDLL